MVDYIFQSPKPAEAVEIENAVAELAKRAEAVVLLFANVFFTLVSLKTIRGEMVKETETMTFAEAIRKQAEVKGFALASVGSVVRIIRTLPAHSVLGIEKGKGIPALIAEAIANAHDDETAFLLKAVHKVVTGQASNTVAGLLGCLAKPGSGLDRQFVTQASRVAANLNASGPTLEALSNDVKRVMARYEEKPAERSFFRKKESIASQVAKETATETGKKAARRNHEAEARKRASETAQANDAKNCAA